MTTVTKPILLDETGKTIVEKLTSIAEEIHNKPDISEKLDKGGYSGTALDLYHDIEAKEDKLKYDSQPVIGSQNSVTSGGIANYVTNMMSTNSARILSYDADGNAFPTKATLDNAIDFYFAGQKASGGPKSLDYVYVLNDETHEGSTSKYICTRINDNVKWAYSLALKTIVDIPSDQFDPEVEHDPNTVYCIYEE